jgi:hypothetical protein
VCFAMQNVQLLDTWSLVSFHKNKYQADLFKNLYDYWNMGQHNVTFT